MVRFRNTDGKRIRTEAGGARKHCCCDIVVNDCEELLAALIAYGYDGSQPNATVIMDGDGGFCSAIAGAYSVPPTEDYEGLGALAPAAWDEPTHIVPNCDGTDTTYAGIRVVFTCTSFLRIEAVHTDGYFGTFGVVGDRDFSFPFPLSSVTGTTVELTTSLNFGPARVVLP